jgi:hypothetical protein
MLRVGVCLDITPVLGHFAQEDILKPSKKRETISGLPI